jgi:predicted enzyme related to lactoylglutathione lyase
MGHPTQPGVGPWLSEARGAERLERLGNQSGGGPFLVVYCEDCRATCAEPESRGVRILRPPEEGGGSVFAHFADLYGNEIVLVELLEAAG